MKNISDFNQPVSFEDNMEKLKELMKKNFPKMLDWIIQKNIAFTELLEEYDWDDIHWIYDFLDWKWYELDSVKLLWSRNCVNFTDDQINDVNCWRLLMWFKCFYELVWDWYIDQLEYIILANKKDHPTVEWIKSFISNVLWSLLSKKLV